MHFLKLTPSDLSFLWDDCQLALHDWRRQLGEALHAEVDVARTASAETAEASAATLADLMAGATYETIAPNLASRQYGPMCDDYDAEQRFADIQADLDAHWERCGLPTVTRGRGRVAAVGGVSGYTIEPVPTVWAGVEFRSRLEANYAALFTLCGWKWEYEPLRLPDWTPDFALRRDDDERAVLVEVKPRGVVDWELLRRRLVRASWDKPNDLLVVDDEMEGEVYERPLHCGTDLFGAAYAAVQGEGRWRAMSFPAWVRGLWPLAVERVRVKAVGGGA